MRPDWVPSSGKPEVWIGADPEAVSGEAARRFGAAAQAAIARSGRFTVALSGGSTPRRLYETLAEGLFEVDWARTHVFFSDERCVPPDHPESNLRTARLALLNRVPVPPEQIHSVRGEDEPAAAAAAYAASLTRVLGPRPALDLLLLGMGADGHTASLFPGDGALAEQVQPAVAVYAAHLQMWRVTLTLPALNAAAQVLVLVTGAEKAGTLRRALQEPAAGLPIQRVQPAAGTLSFLVDRAAAERLQGEEKR